jgi:hypothetical protein
MRIEFIDDEDKANPLTGTSVSNDKDLLILLERLRHREPFLFELVGENGYKLQMGLASLVGCVQHSRSDGEPPYLMALAPNGDNGERKKCINFLMGHTATPVSKRYCVPIDLLRAIAVHFLQTGERSPIVEWEEV